jgi:hypothetical protein
MTDTERIGPPPDHIVETEIDGDIGLYDPGRERVIVLNTTASDVWRLADGEHSLDEIVELLARAYGIGPDDIRHDVTEAVSALIDQGFLPGVQQPR